MNKDLIIRTKKFAIEIIQICDKLPKSITFNVLTIQLIRCSTSIGANYRAARRAKSEADFINKLKIVEEETDETMYFLELLKEIDNNNTNDIENLIAEANELLSIIVVSIKTARSKN